MPADFEDRDMSRQAPISIANLAVQSATDAQFGNSGSRALTIWGTAVANVLYLSNAEGPGPLWAET
jgi:hypothetical protein